jgi:hypothetical protein
MERASGLSEDVGMSGSLGRHGVPAVAVTLALVLLSAVGVAALRPGTASASTVLHRGSAVVVQLPDGSTRPLAEGDEVPRDAVVRAGRDGAVLRTRDRDTWLGGDTAVAVLDGARQALRTGFVMVDARRGPGLRLDTPAGEVTTPGGAVSRVERGTLLRVGSYDGDDPVRVRAQDRRATTDVPRAHQVQVPDGGLPGDPTPLALTRGDDYERALAPSLVMADEALHDLARRLDAGGEPGTVVARAVSTGVPSARSLAAGAPASERSLAYLLASAAEGGPLPERYQHVRELRSAGGSWGVVAELVRAEVDQVAALLDFLLADSAPAVAAAEDVDLVDLLGLAPAVVVATGPGAEAPGPADVPPAPTGSAPAPTTDDGPAPAEPAPAPVPVPDEPVTAVVGPVVDTVVDTVLDLLGASPGPAGDVAVPALPGQPAPAPSPASAGLLGGLLR